MNQIKQIISFYNIQLLEATKITDSVVKIADGRQEYALKKSSLTPQTLVNWENVFHQANTLQLYEVLPVYLTDQGSLYKEMEQTIYYLTPWIKGKKGTIKQLYHSIGKIHAKTKRSISYNPDKMKKEFEVYHQSCKNMQIRLLEYVELFERSTFMSPFELQVCTYYRDIDLALRRLMYRVDQLINEQNSESMWSYSLCHGNLKLAHFIEASHMYLLNWEKASYENAIWDLSIFFKNEAIYYDTPVEKWIDLFSNYMAENKLNNQELSLLAIYLLDVTNYISLIEEYNRQMFANGNMITLVQNLQQLYRQIIFGLHFSDFVEKEYESILQDNLES